MDAYLLVYCEGNLTYRNRCHAAVLVVAPAASSLTTAACDHLTHLTSGENTPRDERGFRFDQPEQRDWYPRRTESKAESAG